LLISKANTILGDIKNIQERQSKGGSSIIELNSNFVKYGDDIHSESEIKFYNEISQDSQYVDMGCPAETSILDEYMGRKESHPETRILQK
jgi:hypothetical protein